MKINDIIINILFYGSEDDKKIIKNSLELSTDFNFKITCKSGIEEIINHIQESTYDIIIFKIAFAKDTEINNLSKILTHIETPAIIITDDIKSLSKNKFIKEKSDKIQLINSTDTNQLSCAVRLAMNNKKFQDQQKQYLEHLSLLSDTITKLNHCEDFKTIYEILIDSLKKIIPNEIIIINESYDKETIRVAESYNLDKYLNTLKKIIGYDISQSVYHIKNITKEEIDRYSSGKIAVMSLYNLLTRSVPEIICRSIEQILSLKKIYVTGFVWENEYFGGGIIVGCKQELNENIQRLIEVLTGQASIKIHKLETEFKLKDSKEKYRLLYENMREGIAVHELIYDENRNVIDYKITDVNQAFEEITGFQKGKVLEIHATKLHKTDTAPFIDIYKEVALNGVSQTFETYYPPMKKYFNISVFSTYKETFVTVFTDITESKLANDALKESEHMYHSLIDVLPDGVTVSDETGKIIYASPKTAEIYGIDSIEEALGTNRIDWIAPESKEKAEKNINALLENKIIDDNEYILLKKNGEKFYGEVNGALLKDSQGKPKGFVTVHRNITERKLVEEKLKKSEELFRKIFEESPIGIVMLDEDLHLIKGNSAYAQMLGYTEDELLKLSLKDITHPNHIATDIENIKKLYKGEISEYKIEKRYIKKNKEVIWGLLSFSKITDKDNNLLYYLGIVEDITTRKEIQSTLEQLVKERTRELFKVNKILQEELELKKKQEYNLRYSETLNRTTINASHDFIVIIDKDYTILMINDAVKNLLSEIKEFQNKIIVGEKLNIITNDNIKLFYSKIEEVIQTGSVIKEEMNFNLFANHKMYLEITLTPVYINNNIEHIAIFAHDISKIKQVEKEIKNNLEKERELNILKSRFISVVSHEFKTPLAAIRSSIELLDRYDEKLDQSKKKEIYLNIYDSIKHTNFLLEDISFIGKDQNGKLKIMPISCNINALCTKSMNDVNALYKERANIQADISPNLFANIIEDMMRQVIVNLLSNAVKYSNIGQQVDFIVKIISRQLFIQIIDKGKGIPWEEQKHIFDAFYRASNIETIKGTGLGLTIVKRIIDIHNGTIQIISELNKGTEVTVLIPLEN